MQGTSSHQAEIERLLDALGAQVKATEPAADTLLQLRQAFVSDVTARQGMEQELRETAQRLRFHMEHSPLAVIEIDAEQRFSRWNGEAERMFGWTAEEVVGKQCGELNWVHEEDRERVYQLSDEMFAGRRGQMICNNRHYRKDGSVIHCEWYNSALVDKNGKVTVLSLVLNVTGRQRAEDALRGSRDRLAMAMEAGRTGLSQWDAASNRVTWDARHYEIFGYEPFSFVPDHHSWRQRVHPEDAQRVAAEVDECILRKKDFVGEHRIIWPSGELRWVRTCGRFGYAGDGALASAVFVVLDITHLRRAQEDAEAASRAKDQFLAVLSHELRTPLTPVLTSAQLMERDGELPPRVREAAAMIRRNVQLETRLIDDLLDLTRISRGKLELHLAHVDLHERVRDVIQMCDSDIRSKQLKLTVELNAADHHVRADPVRCQQVLWNLLKNAVKFTPSGGWITIRSGNPAGGRIELEVRDTGAGIKPELLPRLFNAFEQGGAQVTRRFGGLGLGLAISRELVDRHGGSLKAHSDGEGKGSTFTVEMPTVPAETLAPPEPRGKGSEAATSMRGRLLLVEDHADSAKTMAMLLESYGFEVVLADCVASATDAAQAQDFDLILSDIGLPDGSGLDLMRRLLSLRPIKGIALSGYGTDEDIRQSREAGFSAHLTKPVSLDKLDEILREICR